MGDLPGSDRGRCSGGWEKRGRRLLGVRKNPSRRANSMHNLSRIAIVGAVATLEATTATAAFAGQPLTAPGFPSESRACGGPPMNFQARYRRENDPFPVVTHGPVGPNMSGHATTD